MVNGHRFDVGYFNISVPSGFEAEEILSVEGVKTMSENVDEFLEIGTESEEASRAETGEDNLEFAKNCAQRSVADAKRLYKVASTIYVGLIVINWIVGVCGTLLGLALFVIAHSAMASGGAIILAGFKVLAGTAMFCLFNYAAAALLTSKAKVLANISTTLVKPNI